jgi:pimeloyl-ACP methyl ester carboxylesterase
MPLAASRISNVRFIQHRSAASPMGVRELSRRQLVLMMEADKYPPAEIQRALRIRDLMDDYAVTGRGWEGLEAEAKSVESRIWMSQFIGGLPAKNAQDWLWLKEAFNVDALPAFASFEGAWHVMYGARDVVAPIVEGRALLEEAVRKGRSTDVTIEVIPGADHNYYDAKTGLEREFPGYRRYVPGVFDKMTTWAVQRMEATYQQPLVKTTARKSAKKRTR